MTEEHPGRLLAASLHEALVEELPERLEFYEHWLHSEGLRGGSIGRAPISAVLGFLRAEGEAYDRVVARAGDLAADWAVASIPASRRRLIGWLPRPMRLRAALRVAAAIARTVNPETRCVRRVRRRGTAELHVSGSVFCAARSPQTAPLCGFYAALVVRTLQRFDLQAVARLDRCRAVEGTACVVLLTIDGTAAAIPPAVAA
jgi:hypothetical protein